MKRQIVLDTETTGMNMLGPVYQNHSIIEIGAVEIINRNLTENNFHTYIKPDCAVDSNAFNIHGISDKFLSDKPKFSEISKKFLKYIKNAELIIHNAPFDIGFINNEFKKNNHKFQDITVFCKIIDTLEIARKLFPGKKNNLNALCTRYNIKNSNRKLHSAIYDAKLLARLYLAMTSFQEQIIFSEFSTQKYINNENNINKNYNLLINFASQQENTLHEKYLKNMLKENGKCIWRKD